MRYTPKNNARGFSLVEILVVVAILVAVMALAFPIFGKIRQRSDMIRCSSNLRAMGVAIFAYAADHDGLLPGPTVGDQYSYYSAAHVEAAMQTGTTSRPLLAFLVPYLNLPVPTESGRRNEAFFPAVAECPATKREILATDGKITKDNVKYFTAVATRITEGGEAIDIRPFGYSSSSVTNPTLPKKLGALKQPASVVGLRDKTFGVHDGVTNMLLMDGSVIGLREGQYETFNATGGILRIK